MAKTRRLPPLVGTFASRSVVVIFGMALVLGLAVTWIVDRAIVEESGRAGSLAANSLILHHLRDTSLEGPLTGDTRADFDELVREDFLLSDIFAVKLWNDEGRLVYSSDREDHVGTVYIEDEELERALSGEIVTEIAMQPEAENEIQFAEHGSLIEVYAPLVVDDAGTVAGVFEIYQPYGPVERRIRDADIVVWGIVLMGGVVSYLVQIRIVSRAARRLTETEAEVEEVNERLTGSLLDLEEHSLGTLRALTSAVDAKDSYTARHSLNVTDYAGAIGRRLGLGREELVRLERASLLHDIGKIGIPELVLLKPDRLTGEEYDLVKEHSDLGAQIIESIPFLRDLVPIVRHHHERWDGTGYPAGLLGEDTPRLARILAVADAFDAMTSDRPYRAGMEVAMAKHELQQHVGSQFDPEAVSALVAAVNAREIRITSRPSRSFRPIPGRHRSGDREHQQVP
jgi:putative nucleotidyltransferase with HDIG domain